MRASKNKGFVAFFFAKLSPDVSLISRFFKIRRPPGHCLCWYDAHKLTNVNHYMLFFAHELHYYYYYTYIFYQMADGRSIKWQIWEGAAQTH